MDYSLWAELAENRTIIVLYTGVKFSLIVAVATIVCAAFSIFVIESLQDWVRDAKAWLKRPDKFKTMWA